MKKDCIMCKASKITQNVIEKYFSEHNGEYFSIEELGTEIKNAGGIGMLRPGYRVKQYLDDLVFNGSLNYEPANKQYCYNHH